MTGEVKESTKKGQSKRVLLVTVETGIRGLFCAFRHIYEDMLAVNGTDLNDRSTTSLAGT